MTPQKWLVTGLGNPLLGSDGFGTAVLQRLRQQPDLGASIELVDAHTDLLSLFDRFDAFDGVVLVDAVIGPDRRGVTVIEEDTFGAWPVDSETCHAWSPLLAVKLFRQLHRESRTRFVLVGLLVDRIASASPLADADVQVGADWVRRLVTMSGAPASLRCEATCGSLYLSSHASESEASDRNTKITKPIA